MFYQIYHPVGGMCNVACMEGQYEYERVAVVYAKSLEEAFQMSQANENIRATSVGDIICVITKDEELSIKTKCYIIRGTGFEQINERWIDFVDWSNYTSSNFNQKIMSLIKLAHDKGTVEDLETLTDLLQGKPEEIVAKTTHNSHYDYSLYTSERFKNPRNHVNKVYISRFVTA